MKIVCVCTPKHVLDVLANIPIKYNQPELMMIERHERLSGRLRRGADQNVERYQYYTVGVHVIANSSGGFNLRKYWSNRP
jgi:hypothetical protein